MRNDIVKAAQAWIGTPYRHQHSTRGAGCDCLGLIRGVYRDVIGPEPERTPPYTPSWGEGDRDEVLLRASRRHLIEIPTDTIEPGDMVLFRMLQNMPAKHCGIYGHDDTLIHAHQGIGYVKQHHMSSYWKRRMVAAFRFP